MVRVTRRERFSAAHRLYRADWQDAENFRVFGDCSNPNWHGHNYELFVTVEGEPSLDTGFLIDLKKMKEIIHKFVISKIDHKNVNIEVDFMQGKMASTEVIAQQIFKELKCPFEKEGVKLYSVRLHETENNYVEVFGD